MCPVGRHVLLAHNTNPIGWHIGRVRFVGVSAKWREGVPDGQLPRALHKEGDERRDDRGRGGYLPFQAATQLLRWVTNLCGHGHPSR